MRKIMILLGLVVLLIGCKSSRYNPNAHVSNKTDEVLNGIFDLRFGMTIDEIKAVVDTTLLKEDIRSFKKWNKESVVLYGRRRSFDLERYVPAYDYAIKKIWLYFFDDKLYEIVINEYSPQTEMLLTAKYGTSEYEEKKYRDIEWKTAAEKTSEWDNIKSEKKGIRRETKWKTNNKDITCTVYYNKADDSSTATYSLELTNTAVRSQMFQEEWDYKRGIQRKELDGEVKSAGQLLDEI